MEGLDTFSCRYKGCPQNDGALEVMDSITAPNIQGYQNGTLISGSPHKGTR